MTNESGTTDLAQSYYNIFVEACYTQGALLLLYAVTILRCSLHFRFDFVLVISILLASTCITWPIQNWLKYQQFTKENSDVLRDVPCS